MCIVAKPVNRNLSPELEAVATPKKSTPSQGKTTNIAAKSFNDGLSFLAAVANNPSMLSRVFKRLDSYILPAVEVVLKTTKLNKLKDAMSSARNVIDLIQIDINYIVSGEWKKSKLFALAGNISFLFAGVAGTACWLSEIGAFSLSKAADAIGKVRVFKVIPAVISKVPGLKDMPKVQAAAEKIGNLKLFSWVPRASLGLIVDRVVLFANVFFAADAVQRLAGNGGSVHKTKAALDLSYGISTIALDALPLVGVTNVVGLGILGAVSLGLTVACFTYDRKYKNVLEAA